jgi:hypothetical protein
VTPTWWHYFNAALVVLGGAQRPTIHAFSPLSGSTGWYADGCNRAVDYYGAFAMHFYGLICARALRDIDPARADMLLDRARAFSSALSVLVLGRWCCDSSLAECNVSIRWPRLSGAR